MKRFYYLETLSFKDGFVRIKVILDFYFYSHDELISFLSQKQPINYFKKVKSSDVFFFL